MSKPFETKCPNGEPHDWGMGGPPLHRRCRYCGAHGTIDPRAKDLPKDGEVSVFTCDTEGCDHAAVVWYDSRWWCREHASKEARRNTLNPEAYPPHILAMRNR